MSDAIIEALRTSLMRPNSLWVRLKHREFCRLRSRTAWADRWRDDTLGLSRVRAKRLNLWLSKGRRITRWRIERRITKWRIEGFQ